MGTTDLDRIDTTTAHSARVYNFWLGGKDHYPADRAVGLAVLDDNPGIVLGVRGNRRFLSRAVRFAVAEAGVRQILDIGTGLPSHQPVHEVAQSIDPATRVVYVDNDPIVLVHARALLRGEGDATTYLDADLRDTDRLLSQVSARLDLNRPVALMLLMTMQFVPDSDDPHGLVRRYLDALAPGSLLVLSHPARDDDDGGGTDAATRHYNQRVATPLTRRTRADIHRFFDGLTLVDPGVVPLDAWRPDLGSPQDWPVPVPDGDSGPVDPDDPRSVLEAAARSDVPPSPAYCAIGRKEA